MKYLSTLKLSSFHSYGAELAIADSNNGWWITTDIVEPSVMNTTSDGGLNWTKVHTFDRANGTS